MPIRHLAYEGVPGYQTQIDSADWPSICLLIFSHCQLLEEVHLADWLLFHSEDHPELLPLRHGGLSSGSNRAS